MTNQQNQCLSLLNSSYTHGKNKLNKRIYRKRRPAINVSTCYILARPHWNLRSAVPSLYPFSIYNCILVLYWLTSCCSCCQKVYLICIFFLSIYLCFVRGALGIASFIINFLMWRAVYYVYSNGPTTPSAVRRHHTIFSFSLLWIFFSIVNVV
jgi:hypothetical protein